MQAWKVGNERAETYLRLLAEVELRRAGDQLRGLDAAAGTGEWSDPGMAPFAAAESALWRVVRAGRILAAAGALDRDVLDCFAGELFSAFAVRSRIQLSASRSQAPPTCSGHHHVRTGKAAGRHLPAHRVRPGPRRELASDPRHARRAGAAGGQRPCAVGVALHADRHPRVRAEGHTFGGRDHHAFMRTHAGHRAERRARDRRRSTGQPGTWTCIICRTPSCGRWATRGLATRSGSRAARAGRPPGGVSPGCHPSPRAAPGGLTWSATEPATSLHPRLPPSAARPRAALPGPRQPG